MVVSVRPLLLLSLPFHLLSPGPWLVLVPAPSGDAPVLGLARAIQLSVAPVFLITGISGLIGVLTQRLTRVLDRAGGVRTELARDDGRDAHHHSLERDLSVLRRRMRLLLRAIQCATVTGVLVATVVAVLFISAVAAVDLAGIVVPVFVIAMLTLMAALLLLLRETGIATGQIDRRFGGEHPPPAPRAAKGRKR